jgi:hypothetical protein
VWKKFSSGMLISPMIWIVYSFVIVLRPFYGLQALRKCEKFVVDIGWFPFSLKFSHRISVAL